MTDPVPGDVVYVDAVPHWLGVTFELACPDPAEPGQWIAHRLTAKGKRFKPGRLGGPPIYSIPLAQCRRVEGRP